MKRELRIGGRSIAIQDNWIDRAVRFVSPERGAARLRARMQLALAGGYTGASRSKRELGEWRPGGGSADAEILPDLSWLRDRSHDLERNEPIAIGAINVNVTNVVGTGLALRSKIDAEALGYTDEQAEAWQAHTEREFRSWALTKDCDATRTQNFYGLQSLVFRSELVTGDVFVTTPMIARPRRAYRLALQIIEGHRCVNKDFQRDTSMLAGGIELDQYGGPKGYHFTLQHPGAIDRAKLEWAVVPAFGNVTGRRNVLHVFERRRPDQRRGVPYLAPVIQHLKQLSRYSEAEVAAAVIASYFAVFIKHGPVDDGMPPDVSDSAKTGRVPGGASDPAVAWDGRLSSGLVADLGDGEEIQTANPGRPNATFGPFVEAFCEQIGMALELPKEVLMKSFKASYSASRAALLQAWKFWMTRRDHLASDFCAPVYELWMDEAVSLGRIAAPGYFDDPLLHAAYLGAEWHGDGAGSIDPQKEVAAAEKRMELQITTLEKEAMAYDGGDWRANVRQAARERAARKAGDLLPAPAPVQTSALPGPAAPAKPDGGKEDGDDDTED